MSRARNRLARHGGTIVTAAAAFVAVVAAGAAGAAVSGGNQPKPQAQLELEAEIEAMKAAGLPDDHPKIEMIEEEIDAIDAGLTARPPAEPGVDLHATADQAAAARELRAGAAPRPAWETGRIECEPIPNLLTVDELADATACLGVPQPDGSTRYVAIGRNRVAHVVRFDDDGAVDRLDDQRAPVVPTDRTLLTPDADGNVAITADGRRISTFDVR